MSSFVHNIESFCFFRAKCNLANNLPDGYKLKRYAVNECHFSIFLSLRFLKVYERFPKDLQRKYCLKRLKILLLMFENVYGRYRNTLSSNNN